MKKLVRMFSFFASCVALSLLAGPMAAYADVTLNYTGPNFNALDYDPGTATPAELALGPVYSTSDFVTMSITLSAPLPPDASVCPTPTAFTLQAGELVLTETDRLNVLGSGEDNPGEFCFYTDGDGKIVEWYILFNPGENTTCPGYPNTNYCNQNGVLIDGDTASSFFIESQGWAPGRYTDERYDQGGIIDAALTDRRREGVSVFWYAYCEGPREDGGACPWPAQDPWSIEGGALDSDNDGVSDIDDNCPAIANENQADADGDTLGDVCDDDDDDDGVKDVNDNCPLNSNPDQHDLDGDGAGDPCDDDADGDLVIDAEDACLYTPSAATTNADGCAIADLCPCIHPDGTDKWKNHGKYVSCVAHAANDFRDAGLISDSDHGYIVSEAGQSSCGKKN